MPVTNEIEVLAKTIKLLKPMDADARERVVDYVCKVLRIGRSASSGWTQETPERATSPSAEAPQDGKRKAPQQYLREYSYKIMTKRIGVIAVYLERERELRRFSLKDVTAAFRAAKEKPPAYSQYGRAVVMGYLAEEGDQYYATSKAEQLVDEYRRGNAAEDTA
jgi:hypothetical protein